MAGNGPAPAEQRRRRNEPARGDWVDLPPLDKPILPELPEVEGGWSLMTVATWAAWRTDPVTAMYSPSDVAYALDTIRLYEAMAPSSANEVRIRMDGLGLTPKGKRDLRWRITAAAAAPAAPEKRAAKRTSSRRARLSVVK